MLLYLLTNQITPQGFWIFNWLTITWLLRWLQHTQVVETSVANNSPSQHSNHPDDLFQSRCYCNSNITVNCPLPTLFHRIFNIKNFSFSCNRKGTIYCNLLISTIFVVYYTLHGKLLVKNNFSNPFPKNARIMDLMNTNLDLIQDYSPLVWILRIHDPV